MMLWRTIVSPVHRIVALTIPNVGALTQDPHLTIILSKEDINMAISPPLKELKIQVAENGFYRGFNNLVALVSKVIIALISYLVRRLSRTRRRSTRKDEELVLRPSQLLLYLERRVLHHCLPDNILIPRMGENKAWKRRRRTRVFEFFMVLHDIRRGHWNWYVRLCDRGTHVAYRW